ncbi:MAG TPA: AmmeMemoRadiSam system protein A, partial [Planctomycetota bacterium]|nr:AmmeMemoRadiSam system protein A [Planctomycetota bacterium]
MLSDEDRRTLLDLARRTAEAAARGIPAPDLTRPSGALREKGAAFVTLRVDGQLRGCVGHVQAAEPLWTCVRDMAYAAANDERFPPLAPSDLPGLAVEISLLSPLVPLRPEDIRVGTHGLFVRLGRRAGLLLPQVAVEWGWDAPQFLRRTY